jgi:hypothetical protein
VTTMDGAERFSVKASAVRAIPQQQRTKSKGTMVAIFAVRLDFQKSDNLWIRFLLFDLLEDVIGRVDGG